MITTEELMKIKILTQASLFLATTTFSHQALNIIPKIFYGIY